MKKSNVILTILFVTLVIATAVFVCKTFSNAEKNIIRVPGVEITFEQEIDDGETEMQLIVKAPETCVIGEMVTIDVTASNCDTFRWKIIPETTDFRVITNGQ